MMEEFPRYPAPDDEVVALGPARVGQSEVIQALQEGARCNAVRLLDLEPLFVAWEQRPEVDGQRITLTSLYVRAAALALAEVPRMAWHRSGAREVRPVSLDIGLSVSGLIPDSPATPTTVIRDAGRMTLPAIARAVREQSRAAREQEAHKLEDFARLVRWLPFGPLRRFLIRLFARNAAILRKEVGVFQISNCHGLGIDIPVSSVVPHTLLLPGQVSARVLVIDGKMEIRRSAWVCLMYDHAELVALHAGEWLEAFQRILLDPARIYGDGAPHPTESPQC